jgi:predicted transcriptional regulator
MSGYIKLHRAVRGTAIAQHPDYFAAWVHLLCMASHKPHQQIVGTKVVDLQPGQLVFGRQRFSATTGISENKVRASLSVLKDLRMITSKSHAKFSVITITNWSKYQESAPANNQHSTSTQPALNHEQEGSKNEENKDKDSVPTKVGTSKYSDEFEIVWQGRVKREGNDPKAGAHKCWKANIKRGVTPDAMVEGIERYRKYCEAKGIVGTEMVQMLQTFLGPNENFTQDWAINQGVQTNGKHRGFNGQGHQPISDPDDTSWAEGFDPRAGDFEDL